MFMTGNSYLNDDMLDGKTMNLWWNEPHLIGKMSSNGIFLLKSGILFSASAMNSLLRWCTYYYIFTRYDKVIEIIITSFRHSFVCKFPYNAHNQGVELCINQTIASPNFKDLAKIVSFNSKTTFKSLCLTLVRRFINREGSRIHSRSFRVSRTLQKIHTKPIIECE